MSLNSTTMLSQTVTTFDGTTAFRKDCRFIKGEYYQKNKQCFLIEDTWYRVNSGYIAYDHEMAKWTVMKDNPSLTKGIVSFDMQNNQATTGYFTPNPYKNVPVILSNGGNMVCFDYRILPMSVFNEDKVRGLFVHQAYKLPTSATPITFNNHGYPFNPQYCLKHYDSAFIAKFEEGSKERVMAKSKLNLTNYYGVLGDLTFGIEFETTSGKIPNYKIFNSGLVPLRDGSITGLEYCTLPLKGKDGVKTLEDVCETLTEYCTISNNDSVHLHIGNFKADKKMIGYLYTLCCILENDVYSIFPKYYNKTSLFKARQKDYNMPLRRELVSASAEETFANLSYYLSAGKRYQGFGANHPSDPNGDHKWGINERYHWVNFIPTLFGNSGTVEFRCHIPTRDAVKILNWLYICAAIVKYAQKLALSNADMGNYLKTTLSDVVNSAYSGIFARYLTDYISARKSNRLSDDNAGDYAGTTEISQEMKGKNRYADIR